MESKKEEKGEKKERRDIMKERKGEKERDRSSIKSYSKYNDCFYWVHSGNLEECITVFATRNISLNLWFYQE